MQFLRVALFMIRRRSGQSKSVDVASKGMWRRLVGSMRPLHLQSNASPPPSIKDEPKTTSMSERYDDVMLPPESPGSSISSMSSEDGMSSRYASAVNLQELDKDSGSRYGSTVNLKDLAKDHCAGILAPGDEILVVDDELIDAKAEEFIAQFYKQMRLQRLDSIDRRFEEMNKRSIGY
ncbi:hypothetical protein FEM48_Zijuj09G0015500 [Ziziphus jujuba var. spinosa]|nr:hypothetical protein FEM48_Zijuj09G0015500 [Ziziphus jujuba var. spinosa]